MQFWLCVLATVVIIETLLPALAPRKWQMLLLQFIQLPASKIRMGSLLLMLLGWLLLMWCGPAGSV
ncbi:hypothetical protein VST7929_02554 [Vibrio stylophorae]|uniref:DUF2065 domain-containing protein n=1 Tax=Vibrio stylophorae TaxID=659351 RepID=A0ABN8DU99_9VIBR|nr:DUF2065 domain-containing protein [Vibrio stylophorae]CAH0534609.1 hypothetical protein VST7929_02554 [Vibrio stylophorae]